VETNGQRLLFDTGGEGTILHQNMKTLKVDPQGTSEVSSPRAIGTTSRDWQICCVSREISKNFFSTGELPWSEQSLVVNTEKGLAVICGLSHPGVGTILEAASQFGRVSALIAWF
jgi:7,8-dihydropterin-6-yl-methyl-4-(beta-D-ribofuranosyl)aminobenzene 5'-phosphate synthase